MLASSLGVAFWPEIVPWNLIWESVFAGDLRREAIFADILFVHLDRFFEGGLFFCIIIEFF